MITERERIHELASQVHVVEPITVFDPTDVRILEGICLGETEESVGKERRLTSRAISNRKAKIREGFGIRAEPRERVLLNLAVLALRKRIVAPEVVLEEGRRGLAGFSEVTRSQWNLLHEAGKADILPCNIDSLAETTGLTVDPLRKKLGRIGRNLETHSLPETTALFVATQMLLREGFPLEDLPKKIQQRFFDPSDDIQVLELFARGKTEEEISETVGLPASTVTRRKAKIRRELGIEAEPGESALINLVVLPLRRRIIAPEVVLEGGRRDLSGFGELWPQEWLLLHEAGKAGTIPCNPRTLANSLELAEVSVENRLNRISGKLDASASHHAVALFVGTQMLLEEGSSLVAEREDLPEEVRRWFFDSDPRESEREERTQKVLELFVQGNTEEEIGRRLGISVRTIRRHKKEIRNMLGLTVRSRAKANIPMAVHAVREELVSPEVVLAGVNRDASAFAELSILEWRLLQSINKTDKTEISITALCEDIGISRTFAERLNRKLGTKSGHQTAAYVVAMQMMLTENPDYFSGSNELPPEVEEKLTSFV